MSPDEDRVHPRVSGVLATIDAPMRKGLGSSPRERGFAPSAWRIICYGGFIPA